VVFYGAEDQPTGQCLGYYFVPIRAGEERLFQFDCYRAPPYSRYTIEVVDATHSMGDGD